jgi:hypothetical protein
MIITGLAVIHLQIIKVLDLLIKREGRLFLGKIFVHLYVRSDKASWL